MTDYRPVPDADRETFDALIGYAFSPEGGPFDADEQSDHDHGIGERRGVYEHDTLLAVCRHYDLPVELRGSVVSAGGVGVVASDPARRREGNVRRLLAASLAEYRERGRRLAMLWPFDTGFYGDLGWATVSKLVSWEIAPGDLAGLAADRASTTDGDAGFERMVSDDWRRLVPVKRAAHDTDLSVRRSEAWWREFVFDRWDGTPYVYGWVVDGDLRGYLVYTVEREGDERVFVVRERAARTADARRHLFRFCRDHDSQVDRVRFYTDTRAVAGEGFDPHRALDDPAACDATVTSGAMARLVDVARDLPVIAGGLPGDDRRVDLVVRDPLAEWNDGRFRLEVADGLAVERVENATTADETPTDDASTADERSNDGREAADERSNDRPGTADGRVPTARLGVGALSQVAVGARSAAELARAGTVTGDEAAVAALDDWFPPRRPVVRENF